ncbi:MAG: hypothetical protein MJ250_03580 [Alphaproteobacteria bacterium]|nr:hypothetical protein [Alphaproteobacteria bacterium]
MEHNGQTGVTCLYNMMIETFYRMLIQKYEPHIADVDFTRFKEVVAVPYLIYLSENFEKHSYPEELVDSKELIKRSYWIFVRQFPNFKAIYEEYSKIDHDDKMAKEECISKWLLMKNPIGFQTNDSFVGSAVLFALNEISRYLRSDTFACF